MSDNFEAVMNLINKTTDKYFDKGFAYLSEHEKVLFCVWMLETEVNNGGFNQFYWNSAGDFSIETVESLNKIGAVETSSIVQAANDNFGEAGPPKERINRQEVLEELEDKGALKLDSLDEEFYSYPDDLTELMYQYASAHGLV